MALASSRAFYQSTALLRPCLRRNASIIVRKFSTQYHIKGFNRKQILLVASTATLGAYLIGKDNLLKYFLFLKLVLF